MSEVEPQGVSPNWAESGGCLKPHLQMKHIACISACALAAANFSHAVTTTDGVDMDSTTTVPAGSNSIAAGTGNTVDNESIALGAYNTAKASSIALGQDVSSFNGSVAFGDILSMDTDSLSNLMGGSENTIIRSYYSLLMGFSNTMARQSSSIILGGSNTYNFPSGTSGRNNVMIGGSNTINGAGFTSTSLQNSVLIGAGNTSAVSYAWTFGEGNIGQSKTVILGTYAASVPDASLIVGTGTSSGNRSNGLVVLQNGTVDVPGSLKVAGSNVATESHLLANAYVKKAMGSGASASSSSLAAWGTNAIANGNHALAMGFQAEATAAYSVSLGEAEASGTYGVALNGLASGGESFAATFGLAVGDNSVALAAGGAAGHRSVAIGGENRIPYATNQANGDASVSIGGTANTAAGYSSYAFGDYTHASGDHSFAWGRTVRAGAYSVALGSRNLTRGGLLSNNSDTSWLENGVLFELGNGKYDTSEYSNAITTLKNGNTTLTNKAWKAHVAASGNPLGDPTPATDNGGDALVVEGHTRLKGKVILDEAQGDISMGIYD